MISTSTFILFGPKQITLAETTGGTFRESEEPVPTSSETLLSSTRICQSRYRLLHRRST
uniref:Uncharacterized protein n=1 Tax=Oryza rufipogon TaxID=4529 RepID=A0A0E0Q6L6_ORYRU